MSGSAVLSQKLNVVTRQAQSLAPMSEPMMGNAIFDAAPVLAQHPSGAQAMASLSWAKLGMAGMAGWVLVAAIGYGVYYLF